MKLYLVGRNNPLLCSLSLCCDSWNLSQPAIIDKHLEHIYLRGKRQKQQAGMDLIQQQQPFLAKKHKQLNLELSETLNESVQLCFLQTDSRA